MPVLLLMLMQDPMDLAVNLLVDFSCTHQAFG
jgi:hypothetical protein